MDDVYSLQAKVTSQQSLIKELKKSGTADPNDLQQQILTLTILRAELQSLIASNTNQTSTENRAFSRKSFDELLLRKMYVIPSFEIHNGPAGLFDYGPPACALKANVLSQWRRHFVLEENMLEMECTNLTPSAVLETSGHVDRFTGNYPKFQHYS